MSNSSNVTVPLETTAIIIWSMIGTFTLIFNAIGLTIIAVNKALHTSTNVIIGSMFLSDIFFAVVYIFPRWVGQHNKTDSLYCSLINVIGPLSTILINLHLMAASLDKFLAIQFPFRHHVHATPEKALIGTIIIWIISIIAGLLPIMSFRPLQANKCLLIQYASVRAEIIYGFTILGLFYILPFLVMSFCYTRIYIISRTRSRTTSIAGGSKDKKKQTIGSCVLASVVTIYFVMWTPFLICYTFFFIYPLAQLAALPGFIDAFIICRYIAFSYPAFIPLLYAYFIRNFRRQFLSLCHHAAVSPMPIYSTASVVHKNDKDPLCKHSKKYRDIVESS